MHIDNDREEDKIESQTKMITSLIFFFRTFIYREKCCNIFQEKYSIRKSLSHLNQKNVPPIIGQSNIVG